MDSLKVCCISVGNWGLSLTEVSVAVQIAVGGATLVYLIMKAYYLRRNNQ